MEDFIEVPIPDKTKFTIYTRTSCIYCTKVLQLLKNENIFLVDCDSFIRKDKVVFLEIMEEIIGFPYKTFPMVFKNGIFIEAMKKQINYIKSSIISY